MNQWETLLEGTGYAYFTLDRDWRFTHLNKQAEYFETTTKAEVLGKKIWEAFPRIVETPFYQQYQKVFTTKQPVIFEEFDQGIWFEVRVFPIDSGGLAVYYRDITERKQFDERKDEFIRLASHELKTPITTLRLYAELLQEQIKDPELIDHAKKILNQASQLDELVSELLDLSRIQIGKLNFEMEDFDFVSFARETVETIAKASPTHRIQWVSDLRRASVRGSKARLAQIINNLLSNAQKYSPERADIIVRLTRERRQILLSVQDFGIGIPLAFRPKVFDRFYQVPHNNGDTFPGLGIGLHVSKLIANKHGGDITLHSRPGQGSTFTLTLPLSKKVDA